MISSIEPITETCAPVWTLIKPFWTPANTLYPEQTFQTWVLWDCTLKFRVKLSDPSLKAKDSPDVTAKIHQKAIFSRVTRLNFYLVWFMSKLTSSTQIKTFFQFWLVTISRLICTSSKSDFLLWYFSFSSGYFSNHTFAKMKKVRMFFTFESNFGQSFTDWPWVFSRDGTSRGPIWMHE